MNEERKVPNSIRQWVANQATIALPSDEAVFPYSEYWWKAVACILLSGRVKPKWDKGLPNRTELNRICKEANFSQGYFQNLAEFLIAGQVLDHSSDDYQRGKRFEDFWSRDLIRVRAVAMHGLLGLISRFTPFHTWRPSAIFYGAECFLRSFFTAFGGRALRADRIGELFLAFNKLPEDDLASFMKTIDIECEDFSWESWLDIKGQEALVTALYTAGWAYEMTQGKRDWFCLSPMGRVLLDLVPAPPQPPETKDFKVLPDLSILAGLDLSPKTLALLFRYCKVTRIDRVIEFRLDKATMKAMPSPTSPNKEILSVLKPCAPLPGSVVDFLEDQIKRGGVVSFRTCRVLVKAEMPEILAQISAQPRLQGYLDRGGPPGYLVIKDGTDAFNFIRRCQEHGFDVKSF